MMRDQKKLDALVYKIWAEVASIRTLALNNELYRSDLIESLTDILQHISTLRKRVK